MLLSMNNKSILNESETDWTRLDAMSDGISNAQIVQRLRQRCLRFAFL